MLPCASPAVVFQRVSDGAVLLDMQAEVYFGLNAVGADIWQLLPPTCGTLDQLCDEISRRYPDVDPADVWQDTAALLDELAEAGLVLRPEASRAR